MTRKIPREMYGHVYDFYTKHLDKGVAITKVADLFNDYYGTRFAESSLRNRYEFQRDINNVDEDIVERLAEVEKAERKLALAEMTLVSEQKKVQRKRSAIDSRLRYNADKQLVAEIFKERKEEGFNYSLDSVKEVDKDFKGVTIFNTSDIHLGYNEEGYYTLEQAKHNIESFFAYVDSQIKSRDLKEVIISDTGDQIEGSTLRVTQLSTIAETMSDQAVIFAEIYTEGLMYLSQNNPNTKIDVFFVDEDNHSQIRITGASRGDTKEFLSKVIANDIRKSIETAQRFGGMDNVTFTHAGEIFTNINGKEVLFTHGHQYPKDSKRLASKVEDIHDRRPDVIIHGHYHTYHLNTLNVRKGFMQTVISCPAIVGDTAYGKEGLGLTGVRGFLEIDIEDTVANARFIAGDES